MADFVNRRVFFHRCLRFLFSFVGIRAIGLPEKLFAEETPKKNVPGPYPKSKSIGTHFSRERLEYDLTFMMFFSAANLVMELLPGKERNHYIASFRAETRGFVGWLVGYRKYHFRANLEEIDGGRRFLTHSYEKLKIVGKKRSKIIYQFDYKKKNFLIKTFRQGIARKSLTIPFVSEKPCNDILSLTYNFRYSAFGPIQRERKYRILGLPNINRKKKKVFYNIELFSKKNETRQRNNFDWEEKGYVAKVQIDKDIFSTKNGIIWVLFDENMMPLTGILEDAVVLGDVVGKLKRNT